MAGGRTFKVFKRWFQYHVHSVLIDPCKHPIIWEELLNRFRCRTVSISFWTLRDSLNLLEVVEIVSREHPYDRFDALDAPFVMQPVVLPLLRRESLQECEIRLTQC